MEIALLVIRLLLATVFGVAGLAKLADHVGTQQTLRDFGVPSVLAPSFGLLLPLAELAVAVALLPVVTAWWAACGAFALLLLFVVGLGIALARGRRLDCHCFGHLHSAPAGWRTLARNMVLAAAAGFAVWEGREIVGVSAISWLAQLTPTQAVSLIIGVGALGLLAVEGWLLVHMLRQNGRLLLRVEALEGRLAAGAVALAPGQNRDAGQRASGLTVGAPAPAFRLTSLHGEMHTLDALRAIGKPVILISRTRTVIPAGRSCRRSVAGSMTTPTR